MWVIATGVKEGQQPAEYMWTLIGLTWCVVCVIILLLIVLSCQTTSEECNKAQILVEK